MRLCVHCGNRQDTRETPEWAQVCSEKKWPEERDCSPCMGQRSSSKMGVSQSKGGRNQPCQQENNGGPAHPATATHHQPGLRANHWPCLVPPPVLTPTPYPPCLRSLYLKLSLLSQPALATACITTPYITFPSHLFPATLPLISRHISA